MIGKLRRRFAKIEQLETEVRSLKEWSSDLTAYMMRAHWRLLDHIEKLNDENGTLTCYLCKSIRVKDEFTTVESECIFHGGTLRRYICPNCGVTFGPLKMFFLDEKMLELEYRNLYRMYSEGDTTEFEKKSFFHLGPNKKGRYLNFGCGGGWSRAIAELRFEGWDVYGFEPSAQNCSEFVFSSWDQLQNYQFDGIFSHNVIEHLIDPVATLEKLKNLVGEKSRHVHSTPCYKYQYEFTRFHVFFYTGKSMDFLSNKVGLNIDGWFEDGDYIACIMSN